MSHSLVRRSPNIDSELRKMEMFRCPTTFSTEPYDEDSIILEEAAADSVRDIASRSSASRFAFRLLFFTDITALFIKFYVSNTLVSSVPTSTSPFAAGHKRFAFVTLLCQLMFSGMS